MTPTDGGRRSGRALEAWRDPARSADGSRALRTWLIHAARRRAIGALCRARPAPVEVGTRPLADPTQAQPYDRAVGVNYIPYGTYLCDDQRMTDRILDAMEVIVIGSVAITSRALEGAGSDLTLLQWRAMLVIGESVEGVTITDVSRRLGANLSPTSRLVGRLTTRGLADVGKDASDRRTTRVTLTTAGRTLRAQILERRRIDLERLVEAGPLAPTDASAIARLGRAFEPWL